MLASATAVRPPDVQAAPDGTAVLDGLTPENQLSVRTRRAPRKTAPRRAGEGRVAAASLAAPSFLHPSGRGSPTRSELVTGIHWFGGGQAASWWMPPGERQTEAPQIFPDAAEEHLDAGLPIRRLALRGTPSLRHGDAGVRKPVTLDASTMTAQGAAGNRPSSWHRGQSAAVPVRRCFGAWWVFTPVLGARFSGVRLLARDNRPCGSDCEYVAPVVPMDTECIEGGHGWFRFGGYLMKDDKRL